MRFSYIVYPILVILNVGCTASSDFVNQVGKINKSVEYSSNMSILHNVVQASEGAPLSFTQLTFVHGSGSISGTAGLPSAILGVSQPQVNGSAGLTLSSSTNFDLAVLESKEFWLGLQTPVTLETVAFFVSEGMPREVLFNLFVNKIAIDSGGTRQILLNDPYSPFFAQFRAELSNLLNLGLTTEATTLNVSIGPAIPEAKSANMYEITQLAQAGLNLRPVSTPAGPAFQVQKTSMVARLCFEPGLQDLEGKKVRSDAGLCGSAGTSSEQHDGRSHRYIGRHTALSSGGKSSITIYLRSIIGVFHYLGALMKTGTRIELTSTESRAYAGYDPQPQLFAVGMNIKGGRKLVSVAHRGATYSIDPDDKMSVRVLALLRRLIALNTSVNALPVSNTVTAIVP